MINHWLKMSASIALILPIMMAADPAPKNELKAVEKQLSTIFSTLDVKPELGDGTESLEAVYQTQTFKVHHVAKSGAIGKEAVDEVGPSHKGFILRVYLQKKGELNQAVTPQTIRRPYWLMDLDVTPLANSDKQLYWALSYGSQTDKQVLDEIRDGIRSLGEKKSGN